MTKHLYVSFKAPATQYMEMKFGPSKKDLRRQQEAVAAASKQTPLPDMQDASIRKQQADALQSLLRRRGRSRTLLSGRTGDQSPTAARRQTLGRGQ